MVWESDTHGDVDCRHQWRVSHARWWRLTWRAPRATRPRGNDSSRLRLMWWRNTRTRSSLEEIWTWETRRWVSPYCCHTVDWHCYDCWLNTMIVGPIANLKGPYFQPSLSVCLWPALLPFNINQFWWNLVTRTILWSSLATTIMVQIGRRGTERRVFDNFKKFSKITEFEFQNSSSTFFASLSPVYCKTNWTQFKQSWRRR